MSNNVVQSGLARILSSKPLPSQPIFRGKRLEELAPEMETYVRNLHNYIKDLTGQFTAENLITTIGGGFFRTWDKSYKYHGTNNLTITIDDTQDWRAYDFLTTFRVSTSVTGMVTDAVNVRAEAASFDVPSYSAFHLASPGSTYDDVSYDLRLNASTGALELSIGNGVSSTKTHYIHLWAAAIVKTPSTDGAFSQVGNGL